MTSIVSSNKVHLNSTWERKHNCSGEQSYGRRNKCIEMICKKESKGVKHALRVSIIENGKVGSSRNYDRRSG